MSKKIFYTNCVYCNREIAVIVDKNKCNHRVYSCNNCIPKSSPARNGIEEAFETDLFDIKINLENY